MSRSLRIEHGTTFVAAAVASVHVGENGSLTNGGAAARRAVSDPDRGTHDLDVEISSGEPDTVVLTRPATWERAQCQALADVAESADLTPYSTVTEPEAAAAHKGATRHFESGEGFAVHDLGGGTSDATVLRRTPDETEVMGHRTASSASAARNSTTPSPPTWTPSRAGSLHQLDTSDARSVVALARLPQNCTAAKEAVAVDMGTTVPVFLPGRHMEVRLSRQEFQDLFRVPVEYTLRVLGRTLRAAGVAPGELFSLPLVGGTSGIPGDPASVGSV